MAESYFLYRLLKPLLSIWNKERLNKRNDYLQKQTELKPIKPQSPFNRFEKNSVDKETIGLVEMRQNESKSYVSVA